jgi:hypothetical protein
MKRTFQLVENIDVDKHSVLGWQTITVIGRSVFRTVHHPEAPHSDNENASMSVPEYNLDCVCSEKTGGKLTFTHIQEEELMDEICYGIYELIDYSTG